MGAADGHVEVTLRRQRDGHVVTELQSLAAVLGDEGDGCGVWVGLVSLLGRADDDHPVELLAVPHHRPFELRVREECAPERIFEVLQLPAFTDGKVRDEFVSTYL